MIEVVYMFFHLLNTNLHKWQVYTPYPTVYSRHARTTKMKAFVARCRLLIFHTLVVLKRVFSQYMIKMSGNSINKLSLTSVV